MRNGGRKYGLVSSLPFDVETLPKDIPKQNAFISRFPKYCLTCFWSTISCCSKPPTGTPSPNSTASVVDVLQRCLPTKDWIRMAGWSMAKCGMARKGWGPPQSSLAFSLWCCKFHLFHVSGRKRPPSLEWWFVTQIPEVSLSEMN